MVDEPLDWGALFERYRTMATAFVRGLVGDEDLARDLFQEAARATFERSTRGGVAFDGPAHARNYLFAVLRNLAADSRHDRARAPGELEAEPRSPGPTPPEELAAREAATDRSAAMRAAFATLPPREQQAIAMRYLDGLSYQAIAEATGRSISTLQARVEAGLRRLRHRIGIREDPK